MVLNNQVWTLVWMCNVNVKDKVIRKELRERLGIDDIILVLQQNRLRWYGHVLRKEDTDWVKKYMEYELEGSISRGRPNRMRREVVSAHPGSSGQKTIKRLLYVAVVVWTLVVQLKVTYLSPRKNLKLQVEMIKNHYFSWYHIAHC